MKSAYTICGHPGWSDAACHDCDGCRDARERWRRVEGSAQHVIAAWENDAALLEPALDDLRASLDPKVIRDRKAN